ncbi:MAG: SDR family NAD(P)-dependent oxidoreductase [Candidatus Freyarchaeota archaeon]|nr:SDR family NAD(P)-dependent oxidoreductase [Candidatus Jordarchaeia archaeon]
MKMRVLVTGGAGFIGSHVAEHLAKEGHEVVILDNFSTGSIENIRHIASMSNVKIVNGDVLDADAVMRAADGCDAISHHAAQLEIGSAIRDPVADARINIEGTINVLEASVRKNVRKVIYASSAGIYGEAVRLPQDEDHPKRPTWPYGVSKYSGELYCLQYSQFYGVKTCALRYGIVYGEREWFGRVLTMFIKRAVLDNKPPVIFGDGRQMRDFIYVKDAVKLHNILLEEDHGGSFEAYNVGSGVATSIRDLAELVIELSGNALEPVYEDPPEGGYSSITGRWRIPKELRNLQLDISKALRETGWVPRTRLREGVEREIEWVKSNAERWNARERV